MRDMLGDLLRWWRAGQPAGLATVTATWSGAPRQPGTSMLVGPAGTAVGSVPGRAGAGGGPGGRAAGRATFYRKIAQYDITVHRKAT
jgi:hypothetical protein